MKIGNKPCCRLLLPLRRCVPLALHLLARQ